MRWPKLLLRGVLLLAALALLWYGTQTENNPSLTAKASIAQPALGRLVVGALTLLHKP